MLDLKQKVGLNALRFKISERASAMAGGRLGINEPLQEPKTEEPDLLAGKLAWMMEGGMRRLGVMGTILLVGLFGCAKSNDNLYSVFFSAKPALNDRNVYWAQTAVGEIKKGQVGFANIAELKIALEPKAVKHMHGNGVFIVHNGTLNYVALSAFGDEMHQDKPMLGFSSKAALRWFRFRNLLGNVPLAIARQSEQLAAKMQWLEPQAIAF